MWNLQCEKNITYIIYVILTLYVRKLALLWCRVQQVRVFLAETEPIKNYCGADSGYQFRGYLVTWARESIMFLKFYLCNWQPPAVETKGCPQTSRQHGTRRSILPWAVQSMKRGGAEMQVSVVVTQRCRNLVTTTYWLCAASYIVYEALLCSGIN